jgi:large subunit ribosomal protein L10
MNRAQKTTVVDRLTERLKQSPNVYLTDFTGIEVKSITELRRRLRDAGVHYVVAKNTLARRALDAASVAGVEALAGPTGFVFVGEDPLPAAKVLFEFQKEHKALTVKAGVVDGQRVSPEDIKRLASLPGREQLLSETAGLMQAPLQGFVGALNGLLYQMVGALEALRAQRAAT